MASNKLIKELMRHARAQGWRTEPTRSGHVKWLPPEGPFVISAGSPSDPRAIANLRADLRRHGLEGV